MSSGKEEEPARGSGGGGGGGGGGGKKSPDIISDISSAGFGDTDASFESSPDGSVDWELKQRWKTEQFRLKSRLVMDNDGDWDLSPTDPAIQPLRFVGGVDITFHKSDESLCVAAYVVLSFPELKVVYEQHSCTRCELPYVPGFLAFREAPILLPLIDQQRRTNPELTPQVILVDGNGVLHPRGFGLASHLGVVANIPTIGVGKKLHQVDGLDRRGVEILRGQLHKGGDALPLVGTSGRTWGMLLRAHSDSTVPIYVSVGHRVSLARALDVVRACCLFRVPEPIRQADKRSRQDIYGGGGGKKSSGAGHGGAATSDTPPPAAGADGSVDDGGEWQVVAARGDTASKKNKSKSGSDGGKHHKNKNKTKNNTNAAGSSRTPPRPTDTGSGSFGSNGRGGGGGGAVGGFGAQVGAGEYVL